MELRVWPLAAAIACACGRIDFGVQPADGGIDNTSDAAPGNFIRSATQLVTTPGFSFVDVDVDWTRQLAYTATRESTLCFEVIDLATSPPSFVSRVGPPRTTGSPCLGVSLDAGGARLLVSSFGGNALERWDLGADPHVDAYTQLATVPISQPRRIARGLTATTTFVARSNAAPGLARVDELDTSPWLQAGASFAGLACPNDNGDAMELAGSLVTSSCASNDAPVQIVDDTTFTAIGQIDASPVSGTSGFWTAARTADGQLGVVLGWVDIVVAAGGPNRYTLQARFQNTSGYRQARMIDRGNGAEVVAIRDDGTLDVFSLATPSDPVVTASGSLGANGSGAYAVAVAPDASHAYVVTNAGWLFDIDLSALPPTAMRWPAF